METTDNKKKTKELLRKKLKSNSNNSITNICCCFKFCSTFGKKLKECSLKISILNQLIFYLIPVICFIVSMIILIHIFFFSNILKFDFYTIIKEELLRYFITDLDDINFDLNKKRVSLLFEDVSNLAFFKIYFDELNSYGLLDNDKEKIFPNISSLDQNIYESLEQFNSIFSIPKDMSNKYIDSRNDSLSELAKIYYYFYPIIASETNSVNTFINQTFLISYSVDDNNEKEGKELYFNFPRITDEFIINNNFYPYNNLISPRIESKCDKYEEEFNEPLISSSEEEEIVNENWFIFYDCFFRTQNLFDFYTNGFHLNENNRGSINKTNIVTLHTYLRNNENKTFIINIIYFLAQNVLETKPFEDSVFLISKYITKSKKYSDKQTYVITNNGITEIALSSSLNKYFHYGLSSLNDTFFSEGIFYDNIDINELSEPSKKYKSIDGFNFDLRYFSSFYLYIKLLLYSNFTEEYMETDHNYYYIFNNSEEIHKICSNFDFSLYMDSLNSNEIDCFDDKNLLYYSRENIKSFFSEGLTLPYCICLPLYCIKNLEKDFDLENPEFVDEIILPEKCQNNLLFFDNPSEEEDSNKKDLNEIKLNMGESLSEQLENQFIKFTNEKKDLNGGLNFVQISIIENDSMKIILVEFIEKLNTIYNKFNIIVILGTILIFVLISILLIYYIYSIEKVITDYKEKAYNFLKKLTDCKNKNESNKKAEEEVELGHNNNLENIPLLKNDEKNFDENELVDDLYKIYNKFYKLSENNLLELFDNNQEDKNSGKINKLNQSNELFKLFLKLAENIPKFKLNINMDYDFYKDSKLIGNYKKNVSKKSNPNADKEQILYTESIIKELLSTELVSDYGFITNLNFNYLTNINLNINSNKNNYIQQAIFIKVQEIKNIKMKNPIFPNNKRKDIDEENIKIVFKNKNLIMKKIEDKFEQDDYLNIGKLESAFNTTLIYSFYNYAKKIITDESNT